MVSSVDGKIREQFAAKIQEADWTLAQAQQMAAQMPPGLVAGQAFKVMSPDDWPTWCKYDGQQVLVLGGKDAYRAAVQVADEELAAAGNRIQLPEDMASGFDNLLKQYPNMQRNRVAAVLKVHDGHAGLAAGALATIEKDAKTAAKTAAPTVVTAEYLTRSNEAAAAPTVVTAEYLTRSNQAAAAPTVVTAEYLTRSAEAAATDAVVLMPSEYPAAEIESSTSVVPAYPVNKRMSTLQRVRSLPKLAREKSRSKNIKLEILCFCTVCSIPTIVGVVMMVLASQMVYVSLNPPFPPTPPAPPFPPAPPTFPPELAPPPSPSPPPPRPTITANKPRPPPPSPLPPGGMWPPPLPRPPPPNPWPPGYIVPEEVNYGLRIAFWICGGLLTCAFGGLWLVSIFCLLPMILCAARSSGDG